jgi:hypothetical protein
MANPPPPVKKKGLGCCGCGCLILGLLAILFFALVAGGGYLAYNNALKLTTTSPEAIPFFDGGDDVYNKTQQKLKDFNHDANNHLAATVRLSADEINTLIARNPNFTNNQILLYVTFTDDQARLQSSIPTAVISNGMLKGRYLSGDVSFSVNFNADTKNLSLDLKSLKVGNLDAPEDDLPAIQAETDPSLNQLLKKDPNCKEILNQATSIQIKDNELVIETK